VANIGNTWRCRRCKRPYHLTTQYAVFGKGRDRVRYCLDCAAQIRGKADTAGAADTRPEVRRIMTAGAASTPPISPTKE